MISLERAEKIKACYEGMVSLVPGHEGALRRTSEAFGLSVETVKRYLRRAGGRTPASIREELEVLEADAESSHLTNAYEIPVGAADVIGVIGDTHAPFMHPMYVRFLQDVFAREGVTKVVHIGDLVDNHAISRHVSEPDALDPRTELDMARVCVEELTEAFPEAMLCLGNHDDIPRRQAKELGIPAAYIRNVREVWGVPEEWVVSDSFTINDVYYFHGIGSSGMHAAYNRAKAMGMSVVQGHCHSNGGVKYITNPMRMWFGLDAGCGIDVKRYAFRYGKALAQRPTLGCGIVRSSREAYFIPMDAGGVYSRNRA